VLIDPSTLSRRERYFLLTSCVVPRPIAWIATLAPDGTPNLAPFSFFGGVASDPLTVMVTVGRRRGAKKDTSANLDARPEAVIHIAHRPLAEQMVATSAEVAPEVDEIELAGLASTDADVVAPPRLTDAAIAMEARVISHQEVGNGPVDLFLFEIVRLHLDDRYLVDGRPDPAKLAAVGRLGGLGYCDTAAPFDIARP